MDDHFNQTVNFTNAAWDRLYEVVDNSYFLDKDSQLIYDSLKNRLRLISFGDYLKRYIYIKAKLSEPFAEVPLKEYQLILRSSFADNYTPCSFKQTTAKFSALSRRWLTQRTVNRNVVFLLGFGLNMSVDDVNSFLTKALQEPQINPKNPFEVICWYCYKNHFNYLKFEQLWKIYNETPAHSLDMSLIYREHTISIRNSLQTIHSDASLIAHVSMLKTDDNTSHMGVTARECFDALYDETRDIVANLYNCYEEDEYDKALRDYIQRQTNNARLFGYEKQSHIEQLRSKKKKFVREDITEGNIEQVICAAIPTDRHGNLISGKVSELNEQFDGKRFSRQHISNILAHKTEITRFDLITLNFFIFSQKLDVYPDAKVRFLRFFDSTNAILEKCSLGKLYVQNPYECFVLMCILSEDPLGTYADVWEISFGSQSSYGDAE